MSNGCNPQAFRAVAVVGVGAILPDAPDAPTFWQNIQQGRYSISEVRPARWNPDDYYHPDPSVPDKSYCKIGGWVREYTFDPFRWRMPVPPKVLEVMDDAQKWAVAACRAAMLDYGYPERPLDTSRTAVILGNAMAGENHYRTALRVHLPEYARALESVPQFKVLPANVQRALLHGMGNEIQSRICDITEDTMPGELSNIIAGRVANMLDLGGANFVTDAACASSFAALHAAVEGLIAGHFDAVLTGGIDRNMGAVSFVKFCKIGALSPDGSRPYAEGANGFVMGEGAATFLLKRLEDAERDGDSIYAIIRSIGASSDGRGKGITAPNPIGQQRAIVRAWRTAGLSPEMASYIEGHGTSTRVGDVVEVESMARAYSEFDLPRGSIALGSVKSNIGHLKGAAGASGLLKTVYALRDKVLPPSVNFHRPNPSIDFDDLPFRVNTELRPWNLNGASARTGGVRRAGVSSFGFGGTNFHVVVEEHVPGMLTSSHTTFEVAKPGNGNGNGGKSMPPDRNDPPPMPKAPYRGTLVLGAPSVHSLRARLEVALADARAGSAPPVQAPSAADLESMERLAIDFEDAEQLTKRAEKAKRSLETDIAPVWKPLASQGICRGTGKPGKVAFLYPGQGSQYVNMLRELYDLDPVIRETFREADSVMEPLLGRPLTEYIFVDSKDRKVIKAAEAKLRDTTITQPAVLTVEVALGRLMESYGIKPDIVIGHSLGEYGALVAAGVLPFAHALQVVSARGREMTKVALEDNGCMAAIFAPLEQVERILPEIDGYVVLANINSRNQVVIGGATTAIDDAIAIFQKADYRAVKIPVSHAFHTQIVAPASEPLKRIIERMDVRPPQLPIVANVTGELYPSPKDEIVDLLGRQVASPVQFVKGIETLYDEGARILVEVGPKRVLKALSEDILHDREDVTILFTNHPRKGTLPSLNEALCGLYAAGVGTSQSNPGEPPDTSPPTPNTGPQSPGPQSPVPPRDPELQQDRATGPDSLKPVQPTSNHGQGSTSLHERDTTARNPYEAGSGQETSTSTAVSKVQPSTPWPTSVSHEPIATTQAQSPHPASENHYEALGRLFAGFLEQGRRIYDGQPPGGQPPGGQPPVFHSGAAMSTPGDGRLPLTGSVVVTGTALGLPGQEGKVFDDGNIERLLRGEQFIDLIPYRFRSRMAEKRITRLVKRESGATFETITDPAETIKLAGRRGYFDLASDFGVSESRVEALDIATQLAMAAGIDALRDAGIPLVMHYRTTSKATYLPDRWKLPPALADETGVIFASAFPGLDRMADEVSRYHEYRALNEQLKVLHQLRTMVSPGQNGLAAEMDRRIVQAEDELARLDYNFDRRFVFRVLAMGHSQFAEHIGARGPTTHVNAACASTTHAVAIAEDWIRSGRCRRVIIISGDDVTSENLMGWIGSGFLATGATTTEERLDHAVLPFDRRRNGTIIGMGAAAIVLESEDAIRERGMRGICEVLSSQIANSAYHGTRLDVEHICEVMGRVVGQAEQRFGIDRRTIAPQTVFVSHETYTPARGGSAAAEIHALRRTFGDHANQVVIANTKGYTGHAMGAGIEDVLAIKSLETGIVPPVANIHGDFEPDPELGNLNLSRGGQYPVEYALRLGAGFGSQIAMILLRQIPGSGERLEHRESYDRWLADLAGYDRADLEVEQRTLHVRDQGPPAHQPAPSTWQYGQGPTAWAPAPNGAPAFPSIAPHPTVAPIPGPTPAAPVTPQPVATPTPGPISAAPARPQPMPAPTPLAPAPEPVAPAPTAPPPALGQGEETPVFPSPRLKETPEGPDPVTQRVLAIVSEKTGYPPDMLDIELDVEADLGIDTVKQAEVFAAIREAYDIPRRDDLKLRDYNTLAKVVGFVHEARPDLASNLHPAPALAPQPVPANAAAPSSPPPRVKETPGGAALRASSEWGAQGEQDPVTQRVLAVVSDKTGYPPDMLDLELDVEADLGIDTVKQAEVFAAIREAYDIPRRDDLKLRDYNTLAKVVSFVHEARPDLASALAPAQPPEEGAASSPPLAVGIEGGQDPVTQRVLAVVSDKTGYPPDMLDLELDVEADLGIDTVKQAEVFAAIREAYDIPRRDDLKLRDYNTLAKVVGFVHEARPDLASTLHPAAASAPATPSQAIEMAPLAQPPEEGAASPPPQVAGVEEGQDPVIQRVLAVVSDKTGYPPDMLDLELDVEADLGIDTVKQAEVFAAIREAYDIPRRDDLKLRDYNTLAKVVGFVHEARPDLASNLHPAATSLAADPVPLHAKETPEEQKDEQSAKTPSPTAGLEATRTIPRRVPMPVLRPELEVCKATGVSFAPESRVLIVNDSGKAGKYLGYRLRARKAKALILKTATPDAAESQITEWLADGPINGVYFLPALDPEPALGEMDLDQWRAEQDKRIKTLYTVMRALPNDAFLISATRLGGLHGYSPQGATAPLGGAVTGFTKAYSWERPDALTKAVDFALDADDREIAERLVNETLSDPGAVEIGYHNGQRFSVGLFEQPVDDVTPKFTIDCDTVFVITGAAGGITATIAADLAYASAGTFYLTDIAPAPDPDNPDLARLGTDDKFLKRDIAKRIMDSGQRPTPVMVERELAALERSACIVKAMQEIERAGGTAHYHACDVTDAGAIQAMVDEVQKAQGHVDVIVHAAGMERSHFLPDKPPREFNLIFDVKADGLFNLLKATEALESPLQAVVVFSSIAGRFGNAGQTDYSAANDLMCKVISSMRTTRPDTRGIATDWSAWARIGMATRRSIPEMMRRAGIDMLDPEAATPIVRREIIAGTKGEILVAQSLGILLEPRDPDGGLDLERANSRLKHDFPVAGKVIGLDAQQGMRFEIELDPQVEPFLHDHAMDGIPLLPGVMGIEGFAEVASLIASDLGCAGECFAVASIEDVNFESPLKFYRQQPRKATWRAVVMPDVSGPDVSGPNTSGPDTQNPGLVAHVTLESTREIAATQSQQHAVHFSGRVHLVPLPKDTDSAPATYPPSWNGEATVAPEAIYRVYFHGPAFQVLDGVQAGHERVVGRMRTDLPPMTGESKQTLTPPLLIELCLQTAGVWEIGKTGTLALPTAIDRVVIHHRPENGSLLYAEMEPKTGPGDKVQFDGHVVDEQGTVCVELYGYRTARLPDPIGEEKAAPLRAAIEE